MINYSKLINETKDLSILFVEDYEFLRLEMKEVLEEFFKDVSVASNGEEALETYQNAIEQNKHFDLLISDIQMPIMNGVELSKKIKEHHKNQTIIILSGHSDSQYLIELINIGVSKFLTKPIAEDEFYGALYDEAKKINAQKHNTEITNPIITLGEGYTWDSEKLSLKQNDSIVALSKHELILLMFFMSKKNYICTTEEIIKNLSENDIEMNEKNIRNLIFKVRRKIPQKCISSVYGFGYKFVPEEM